MAVRADQEYRRMNYDEDDLRVKKGDTWRVDQLNGELDHWDEWLINRINLDGTISGAVISRHPDELENTGLWMRIK